MKRIVKFILSFFKDDWIFSDYPVDLSQTQIESPIGIAKIWRASIRKWCGMQSERTTPGSALKSLKMKFQEFKSDHDCLPRPGTRVHCRNREVIIAPRERMDLYVEVAKDFFRQILDTDYDSVLITDLSSLFHFVAPDEDESVYCLIENVYGVDIRDIEDGNFVRIFERLAP